MKMTIVRRDITIPSWAVNVFIPALIAVVGYVIGLTTINARTSTRLDNLERECVRIEASKANDEKVEAVESTLQSVQGTVIRIEQKLDRHIADSK
jgi:hypothetical protein